MSIQSSITSGISPACKFTGFVVDYEEGADLMCPFPFGVVAQLEERLNGIQEVVGSNPIGSTNFSVELQETENALRDDYIQAAQKVIKDPNILINVVSRRVKQLKMGQTPLVESLERLSPEDIALREIMEGKISYELWEGEKK